MWYVHYGIHLRITQSLFKRRCLVCLKLYKHTWKQMHCKYVWYKLFITWTVIQKNSFLVLKIKGKEKSTFLVFYNEFLSSSKQLKCFPKYCVFPIKNEDMRNYNPQCFMSGGFMLDNIIVNIFSKTAEHNINSVINKVISRIKDDEIFF